jgi:type I restriction enzyme S subunit
MSTPKWQTARLVELIEIKHGFAFKGEFFRDSPPGDILLTPGNFAIAGGFKSDKLKYYDGPVPEDFVLAEGDLLVTMTDLSKTADTLGYPALVPKATAGRFLHNQRLGRVIVRDESRLDKGFLFYLMRTDDYRNEILASATGTTVKHTSPIRILNYQCRIPPIAEQRRCADILRSLDDKIEVNRRMNETLDAMARALFKSWFVDFGPVHAKAAVRHPPGMDAATASLFPNTFEDSSLGPIPTGWRTGALSDIAIVIMGTSPPGDTYNEEGIGEPLVNGPVEFGDRFPVKTKWTTAPTRLSKEGDLIFCVRGSTTGRRVASDAAYCLGRGVCAIRSSNGCQPFVTQTVEAGLERLLSKISGSVFPNLNGPDIKNFEILLPPESIVRRYCTVAQLFTDRIKRNCEQSSNLVATRDALLPRLLSGDITVTNRR